MITCIALGPLVLDHALLALYSLFVGGASGDPQQDASLFGGENDPRPEEGTVHILGNTLIDL